ncbi:MAG: hypothetical protein WKH64_01600 [Chloroflexia bacterium]
MRRGLSNREIARNLHVSEATVRRTWSTSTASSASQTHVGRERRAGTGRHQDGRLSLGARRETRPDGSGVARHVPPRLRPIPRACPRLRATLPPKRRAVRR